MERLHSLTRLSLLLLALVVLPNASAEDYCSLVVRVLSPDQQRLQEIPISVREKSGRVIEKDTTSEDVRFCDLGILPVTVTVGIDPCNQVVVRDVPLAWKEEYFLIVTYDRKSCVQDLPPPPFPLCQVLLRVADLSGNWIEKASIRLEGTSLTPQETDRAGRAEVLLRLGNRVAGVVHAAGYASKSFTIHCSRAERVHELPIQLDGGRGR